MTNQTDKPIHTPGPTHPCKNTPSLIEWPHHETRCDILAQAFEPQGSASIPEMWANARLLSASYNAFDAAARKLGVNAVELAESMAEGGIVELVEALKDAREQIKALCSQDDVPDSVNAALARVKP